VCLYTFTEGQSASTADVSNSTFSPGSLQFGSTASWIPDSIGVRLAARAPGETPGTGLTSTSTLANWTLRMRALQTQSPVVNSEFTVELWLRSSNDVRSNARALVGFRDWSSTFATPGQEYQSFGMELEGYMSWYVTDAIDAGRLDTGGGSFNISLPNSSSLMMVTLSYCKRVSTNLNFGDCYVNDALISSVTMAYCLTIRGGMNFTSCKTSASTASIKYANIIDFSAWSPSNKFQFAPFYRSNASDQPHTWAGDIFLAAVYAQSLNGSVQAQNYAAGLPNSKPNVAATAQMSAFEDTLNASMLFALTGYDFDEGDVLSFDIVQLPSVGALYNYNTTHFLPITGVPYRITGATPLVGYLQAPALTYGRNFTSFQFRAWDGQDTSPSNCTVTVNVFNVNHVPHAFPTNQTVNAQVPTSIGAFNCADPDAPTGDYIAQYCIASAPEFGGTLTANASAVSSFPYCFSSNMTGFQLLYTSVAIGVNATNVTDVFRFYCQDTFGTHSNLTSFNLYVQNSVWAVAGTSTGEENGNITVRLLGTSNTTTDIRYHIVGLPVAGALYNGNLSQINTLPAAVVNASGCVRGQLPVHMRRSPSNTVYFVPPMHFAGLYACAAHRTHDLRAQELHAAVHGVGHGRHLVGGGPAIERDARKLRLHGGTPAWCVSNAAAAAMTTPMQLCPATRPRPLPSRWPSRVW
jgi:hypothetical protein